MNINKLIVVGAGLALAGCCCKPPCCQNSVVGNWSAKLPYDDMFAGRDRKSTRLNSSHTS